MVTDWRSLASIKDGMVHLDHTQLDIFDVSTTDYSGWKPLVTNLKPYEDLIIAEIDLETTGLDPKTDQITMIGLYIHGKGVDKIIVLKPDQYPPSDDYELVLLKQFGRTLQEYGVEIVTAYNGYAFDFPFLIERYRVRQVTTRLQLDYSFETVLRNTSVNGQPLKFFQSKHPSIQFIDIYCQVHQDDFVTRKLTSFSLKQVPIQWGMREASDRLELTNDQIQACWQSGDWQTLETYLIDDLKDLKALTDRLLPSYYYQLEVLPKFYDLQKACNWGNATKTNHLLQELYSFKPSPDPKLKFKGGYTEGHAGLFQYPCKIDVASMYPFIMLAYNIHSYKDPEAYLLKFLYYFRSQRLVNKALGKKGDLEAKRRDGYQKIFINSMFGSLGTTNKPFNDMVAAAAVTAYGRALVKRMKQAIIDHGGTIIEVDSDGIFYNSASPEQNKEIHLAVLKVLPDGLNTPDMIEFELNERAIWIPEGEDRGEDGNGQRKNYLIFNHDSTITKKGRFAKRDRSVLERTLQAELIRLWLDSPESAKQQLESVKKLISEHVYPVEQLQITRLVKSNEKTMPALGFPAGTRHTWHYCQIGYTGKRVFKPNYVPTKTIQYSSEYYLDLVDKLVAELPKEVRESLR